MPKRLAALLLVIPLATGCSSLSLSEKKLSAKPYAATRQCAEVAWDVGAGRYRKYTSECPEFVGWFSLCTLPIVAIADTVVLPAQAIHSQRLARSEPGKLEVQPSALPDHDVTGSGNSSEQSGEPELPSTVSQ